MVLIVNQSPISKESWSDESVGSKKQRSLVISSHLIIIMSLDWLVSSVSLSMIDVCASSLLVCWLSRQAIPERSKREIRELNRMNGWNIDFQSRYEVKLKSAADFCFIFSLFNSYQTRNISMISDYRFNWFHQVIALLDDVNRFQICDTFLRDSSCLHVYFSYLSIRFGIRSISCLKLRLSNSLRLLIEINSIQSPKTDDSHHSERQSAVWQWNSSSIVPETFRDRVTCPWDWLSLNDFLPHLLVSLSW